jgi:hypothetical protein
MESRIVKNRAVYLVLVALMVIAAACDGSDETNSDTTEAVDTTTAADGSGAGNGGSTETTAAADTGDNGGEQVAAGEGGSFTVNGTEFAVTLLNRCIPFQDEPGNVDLQALAQAQGGKLNLYVAGESVEVSVDGSGIEEMFGSIAFGDSPVVHDSAIDGDRWIGSATVGDSLDSGDTVDVTWDVMIPAEAIDCSL